MDYAATNQEATVRYHASDMCLHIHSDASYLSEPKARSQANGHYFLSSAPIDPSKPPSATAIPPHTMDQFILYALS
eukprot:scaffold30905_cov98-Attheya_sp.AAC.1